MARHGRTLASMWLDYPTQQRLALEVRDLIIAEGGSWPSVEAALAREFTGDEFEVAEIVAYGMMHTYRGTGGPAFFARWQATTPAPKSEPARPRKRHWRVA